MVEVLAIREGEVIWRREKLEELIKWVRGEKTSQMEELAVLLKRKDISPLIHKYDSKF